MDWIADVLMVAGTLGVGLYCAVLARRLRRFTDLERGVGGAVAVLSVQVDDLTRTLAAARAAADGSVGALSDVSERAENAARHLELLLASLHDLPAAPRPGAEPPRGPATPYFVRQPEAEGLRA